MAKCSKCKKEIKNIYWLNGKAYGYNCYKQELAMILAEKERLANEKYQLEIAATVEILKNRNNLNDFLKSIIKFYEENGFLSPKQIKCIKLSNDEQLEKILIIGLNNEKYINENKIFNIKELLNDNINLQDERLINFVKSVNENYRIIRYKDEDIDHNISTIIYNDRLSVYEDDDFIKVLDLI